MKSTNIMRLAGAAALLLIASGAQAQEKQSTEDLAKAAQNPIADLASLPLQNNTNFVTGPYNETQNILNVQPVIPFHVTEDWNVISRTILPVINQVGFHAVGSGRLRARRPQPVAVPFPRKTRRADLGRRPHSSAADGNGAYAWNRQMEHRPDRRAAHHPGRLADRRARQQCVVGRWPLGSHARQPDADAALHQL